MNPQIDRIEIDFNLLNNYPTGARTPEEIVRFIRTHQTDEELHSAFKMGRDPLQAAIENSQRKVKAELFDVIAKYDIKRHIG